ncbi:hypothetical protein E2C01_051588 [Portunus trituberculatus]|uniref:Uncharacterized protein n=1 Tax=Portunus trituberculatus TaxID=210409 RepID=A0A5B7GM64_PORTR|nr:hypothetical protein [Portunus trituberculatus]
MLIRTMNRIGTQWSELVQYESYPLEDAENYHYPVRGEGDFVDRGHYPTYSIPEEVKKYITYFRDAIRDGNIYDIPSLYVE